MINTPPPSVNNEIKMNSMRGYISINVTEITSGGYNNNYIKSDTILKYYHMYAYANFDYVQNFLNLFYVF